MTFRPYPSVDRAMNQLGRHYPDAPAEVVETPECLRPVAESFDRLRVSTQRAAGQGFGVGAYLLSTRHPSVVGGGS